MGHADIQVYTVFGIWVCTVNRLLPVFFSWLRGNVTVSFIRHVKSLLGTVLNSFFFSFFFLIVARTGIFCTCNRSD